MKSNPLQRFTQLLFCVASYSLLQVNATRCDCQAKQEIDKTRDHLKLVTRISALKLLPRIREIIYHTESEKLYFLHRAKYDALKDLRSHYGNLLAHTDIVPSMDVLTASIQSLLSDNRTLTYNEIHSSTNASVTKFHTNVLPSAFLCFALGTCRSASSVYMECMRGNVQQWTSLFADEPLKMAKNVADSIWSYRRVDAILQVLQKSLITAEEEISDECAHRFSNVTLCPKCLTDDTVEYCRDSCQFASFSCLENLAKKWETNIDELYELTRSYNEGFLPIAQVIGSRMRRLLELKAPRLAKVMVSRCGPLHKDSGIYATPLISTKLLKPRDIQPMVKELVDNMRTLRKCWIQIAARTCADASEGEFCWNGTSTVRLQLADDLGIGIKDVRPRPKETWLESSGHPYDTDDEDFISSGSGLPPPFDEVEDTTVYTIAPAVTPPATPPSTPTIEVEEVNAPQVTPSSSSCAASVLVLLVTSLFFR